MPRFNILFSIYHTLSSQFYIPFMGAERLPAVKSVQKNHSLKLWLKVRGKTLLLISHSRLTYYL